MRYFMLEEALQIFFGDDEQSEMNSVIVSPENAEASDDGEGNSNILNNDNKVLQCIAEGSSFKKRIVKLLVSQSSLVEQYSAEVREVDLCDNLGPIYRIGIRGKI
ncbi:hypothetical protein AVEN_28568-1 [Araneus ventricosus]|uniref:Uncharacterized protein n=1 Tax=Araneus ventricosus TaxID=182803 RepID=A0A4Y2VBF2_ARAVE|nr:hypothetical protein AVEN_3696-1 [Araneus ventricosus]GBO21069.1 hypothetical protein AVEN_28568-1 [Araneus ventricosus]